MSVEYSEEFLLLLNDWDNHLMPREETSRCSGEMKIEEICTNISSICFFLVIFDYFLI